MPLLLWGAALQAQEIGYDDFMRQVAERNAGYLAEKYNVEIAVANARAATRRSSGRPDGNVRTRRT